MRIFLLDSAIRGRNGHHDHFARGFRRALEGYAAEAVICVNQAVDPDLQVELGALKALNISLYNPVSTDRYDGPLVSFQPRALQFARDLGRLRITDEDVLFLPTATPPELAGVAAWMERSGRHPGFAALFHWANPPLEEGSLSAALLRFAGRALLRAAPARLWLGATTARLAEALSPILPAPVEVAPSVTFFEPPRSTPPVRTEPVLKVGFLGSRRLEKGVDLHARLLGAVLKSRLPIQVLVQRHRPNAPGDPLDAFKSHPRVRLVDGWMTDAAMAELVQSLDAVMLPYDPARYGAMVSGVFTLAAGYGKPCVVPAGTWMAERIEAGEAAGVIYGRFGGDSMMAALQSLCDNIELYADQAADLAERWRRNYSADALVDRMMRWAEIPPRAAPPPPVMTREPELAQAR